MRLTEQKPFCFNLRRQRNSSRCARAVRQGHFQSDYSDRRICGLTLTSVKAGELQVYGGKNH